MASRETDLLARYRGRIAAPEAGEDVMVERMAIDGAGCRPPLRAPLTWLRLHEAFRQLRQRASVWLVALGDLGGLRILSQPRLGEDLSRPVPGLRQRQFPQRPNRVTSAGLAAAVHDAVGAVAGWGDAEDEARLGRVCVVGARFPGRERTDVLVSELHEPVTLRHRLLALVSAAGVQRGFTQSCTC